MKPASSFIVILLLGIIMISSCQKQTAIPTVNNTIDTCQYDTANYTFRDSITLWNKPADTIQKYIQGSWNLLYSKGGFSGGTHYGNNIEWRITKFNNLVQIDSNQTATVKGFHFQWNSLIRRGNDSSFVMQFNNSWFELVAFYRHKDTLMLSFDVRDGFDYYFVKKY